MLPPAPMPSCPRPLSPQQRALPLAKRPQTVCAPPSLTWMAGIVSENGMYCSSDISEGLLPRLFVDPLSRPSWPELPRPQQRMRPGAKMAHVVSPIAATSVALALSLNTMSTRDVMCPVALPMAGTKAMPSWP